MTKYKYEVVFNHESKKFLVCGGASTVVSDDLAVMSIFGSTDIEKSRAYNEMSSLRKAEKIRRKAEYQKEV